jgi:co-chaperonin GroES (HSP10)
MLTYGVDMGCFNQRPDVISQIKEELGSVRPPRDNWVILLHDEIVREKETDGGILVLAEHADTLEYRIATVIGIGKDVLTLKEGDRVVISKHVHTQIPHSWSNVCAMVLASEDQVDAMYE